MLSLSLFYRYHLFFFLFVHVFENGTYADFSFACSEVHFETECDLFPLWMLPVFFADCELSSVSNESEKYFTIPRSGEMSAAFRAAMFPKRPASTAGLCSGVTSDMGESVTTSTKFSGWELSDKLC